MPVPANWGPLKPYWWQVCVGWGWALRDDVSLVGRHLRAAWEYDWTALDQTLSGNAELRISHGDWTNADWGIGNFYRYLSQAWDFTLGDVQLSDLGDGIVKAKLCLTNGGAWAKKVEGEYHVSGNRIDSIRFVDSTPFELSGAPR
jgi:hypothetical protein